jgi:hypothetical protein
LAASLELSIVTSRASASFRKRDAFSSKLAVSSDDNLRQDSGNDDGHVKAGCKPIVATTEFVLSAFGITENAPALNILLKVTAMEIIAMLLTLDI